MYELLAAQAAASLRSLASGARQAYRNAASEALNSGGSLGLDTSSDRTLFSSFVAAGVIERELHRSGATFQSLEHILSQRVDELVRLKKPADAVLYIQALKLLPREIGTVTPTAAAPRPAVPQPMASSDSGSPEIAETSTFGAPGTFTEAEVRVLETSLYFSAQHGRIEWGLFRELYGRLQPLKGSTLPLEEELAELPQALEFVANI